MSQNSSHNQNSTWRGIWTQFQQYLQPSSQTPNPNNQNQSLASNLTSSFTLLHPIHLGLQQLPNPRSLISRSPEPTNDEPVDLTPSEEVVKLRDQLKKKKIPQVKYLALSGGGVKGFAYIGCFQALKDLGRLQEVEEISGTSIGSVFGFFHILKYTPEELYSFIKKFDYKMIKSLDFMNLFRNWGIETGEKAVRFLQSMVRYKLQRSDFTFQELYEYHPVKFTVVAVHLNTNQAINYNHINTPHHSVIDAIRKSISIPGMFTPVMEKPTTPASDSECKECQLNHPANSDCPDEKNLDYYVDGALINNFPIDQVTDSENTLGFCFVSDHVQYTNITCFEHYVQQIFLSCLHQNTIHKVIKYRNRPSHIIVLDSETSTLQLNFDYQVKKDLWEGGYKKVIEYYQSLITQHPQQNPDLSEDLLQPEESDQPSSPEEKIETPDEVYSVENKQKHQKEKQQKEKQQKEK